MYEKKKKKEWNEILGEEIIEGDGADTTERELEIATESARSKIDESARELVQKPVIEGPERPEAKMLIDLKSGRIERQAYFEQLRVMTEAKTQLFRQEAEAAITAHKIFNEVTINTIQELAKRYAEDIINATEEKIHASVNKSIETLTKEIGESLRRLADVDAPPQIIRLSQQKAIEAWQTGVNNVILRHARFSGRGKQAWD